MILVAIALFAISVVYASVGQAGGTGFLAVMAVAGVPVEQLRPTALAMNIVAASYTTWRLHVLNLIDWRMLRAIILPALPASFVGGLITLPSGFYFSLTGALLVAAAVLMVVRPKGVAALHAPSPIGLVGLGVAAGLLSGITGIGGGIFLAPALIVLGWATVGRVAGLSAPFILGNSITGLAGVLFAGQHLAPDFPLFASVALIGAVIGTLLAQRYLTERAIRLALAAVVSFAGFRLKTR